MTKLDVKFNDYFKLKKPSADETWKDSFGNSYTAGNGLRVKIEATHSAFTNINRRWYSPSRMKDGTGTFLNNGSGKPAKVLKHHDSMSDPVGIVRFAEFIPTVPTDLIDNPDVLTLLSSTSSMPDQIKAMNRLDKSGVTSREDWKGLGFIDLTVDILDEKAIKQVQDGLFDEVSTSFNSPGHAYCNVCGQNWGQDGICEHDEIGEIYEDSDGNKIKMMLIPGLYLYDEVSLVVRGADPHTAITLSDSKKDGFRKEVKYDDSWKDSLSIGKTSFEFKDFKEDNMATPTLSDSANAVLTIVKELRTDKEESVLKDFAVKIANLKQEDGFYPDQELAGIDEKTAIEYALEDLETADQKLDADSIYAEMEKELDEAKLSDAKLSTESRKALPGSAFCGPDRSFPVPDCSHVTAAKRLIGRYKGPGNKSNILGCVNKKAKSLGCDESKSDSPAENKDNKVDLLPCAENSIKDMKDSDLRNLYMSAEVELVSRGQKMAYECKECALSEEKVKKAADQLAEAKAETEKHKDTLTVLREELRHSYTDYAEQVDITIQTKAELQSTKVDKLALVGVLGNKYDSIEDAKTDIGKKALSVVEESINDSFDLKAIVAKLNDGMSNKPNGEQLEDPTHVVDGDNPTLPEGLTGPAAEAVKNIKEFIQDGKISDAKHIYATMKQLKQFPDDLTFESFSVEDKPTDEN